MILDIGRTRPNASPARSGAGTVVWNGRLAFSNRQFAKARARSRRPSRAAGLLDRGCGDTIAAIEKYGVAETFIHLDGGRRVPRIPRGQEAAGRRNARTARRR